ncbi:GLE1-domain-containing protein [Setomelanomma holmii]|uniref:mRNA export factor GLE1 n=1 Tax=Setomelanomma holmii TaxID=210430 RepID=A0A9P4HIT5_9PLEO|nr:GLE1-domain-containing protein [Setomelanomma holmii]
MNTTASFGSSFMEGSPSRQSPTRRSLHTPRGSIVRDPYDSPSRQIAIEFNLRLSLNDRDFNERLDQAAEERAKLHQEQLARAAEEHRKVLRGAELEVQRIELEEEQRRLRREEEQQQEIERLQREKAQQQADAHRRALEARQREEEAARRAAEHQRQLQETEARLKTQKEQEAAAERQKKEKEEADRKAKEAADTAERARAQQAAQAQAAQPARQPVTATLFSTTSAPKVAPSNAQASTSIDQVHAKYLQLHARMKEFRVSFANEHKQKGNPLKGPVGDTRRNIRLRLGQINTDRKDSVAAIKKLREDSFNVALNTPGPTIDIRPYLISQDIPPVGSDAEAQYPAFLLYLWICFEKFVLKQFEKEAASTDGRTIQEIGLIAASLLADPRYMWNGIPLTDVVLAKLHRICPILFGIRGTMSTAEGQIRLGWLPIDKNQPSEEQYGQRMRGLGAGYAALSLRSFNAKAPAIPMSEYWRAIVSICNTPSEDLWPGHFAILYGMIRDYYKKFLTFYGAQARGVLRRATIDLPARAPPRCKDAAGPVSVLPLGWRKENIMLD